MTPLSHPENFRLSIAFPSLRDSCLQAVISSNVDDTTIAMTEKSASSGAGSERSGASAKSKAAGGGAGKDTCAKDSPAAAAVKSETTGLGSHSSSKKRRKVNHGKLPLRGMRQGSECTLWAPLRMAIREKTLANVIRTFSVCLLSPLGKLTVQ